MSGARVSSGKVGNMSVREGAPTIIALCVLCLCIGQCSGADIDEEVVPLNLSTCATPALQFYTNWCYIVLDPETPEPTIQDVRMIRMNRCDFIIGELDVTNGVCMSVRGDDEKGRSLMVSGFPSAVNLVNLEQFAEVDRAFAYPNVQYLRADYKQLKSAYPLDSLVCAFPNLVGIDLDIDSRDCDLFDFQWDVSCIKNWRCMRNLYIESSVPLKNIEQLFAFTGIWDANIRYTKRVRHSGLNCLGQEDVYSASVLCITNKCQCPLRLKHIPYGTKQLKLYGLVDCSGVSNRHSVEKISLFLEGFCPGDVLSGLMMESYPNLKYLNFRFSSEDRSAKVSFSSLGNVTNNVHLDVLMKNCIPVDLDSLYSNRCVTCHMILQWGVHNWWKTPDCIYKLDNGNLWRERNGKLCPVQPTNAVYRSYTYPYINEYH